MDVLELLAAVAMLYGGLARTPMKEVGQAGVMIALGLSCAYLVLDLGALARNLPIDNRLALAREIAAIALLAWLFAIVSRESVAPRSSPTLGATSLTAALAAPAFSYLRGRGFTRLMSTSSVTRIVLPRSG